MSRKDTNGSLLHIQGCCIETIELQRLKFADVEVLVLSISIVQSSQITSTSQKFESAVVEAHELVSLSLK